MLKDILEFLFGPLRDGLYGCYFHRREEQKRVCHEAFERLRKEKPNFQHIVAGKEFTGEDQERAVTVVSFELVAESMKQLQRIRKFKKPATKLLQQAQAKNAKKVLAVTNELEVRLDRFCSLER